jgi:hypothetical protein
LVGESACTCRVRPPSAARFNCRNISELLEVAVERVGEQQNSAMDHDPGTGFREWAVRPREASLR